MYVRTKLQMSFGEALYKPTKHQMPSGEALYKRTQLKNTLAKVCINLHGTNFRLLNNQFLRIRLIF
jgi:hypothetical protein